MKHYVYVVSSLLLVSIASLVYADDDDIMEQNNSSIVVDPLNIDTCQKCASPLFIPRPQSLNSAALYTPFYYPCCKGTIDQACTVSLGFRYEQTWNGKQLAQCLFGSDVINFAGSQATKEPSTYYLLAENFGLSPDFLGAITFDPLIRNSIIDIGARCELGSYSSCLENLYVGLAASLVNSTWNLRAREDNFNTVRPDKLTLPQCLHGTTEEPALGDIKTALSGQYSFGQLPRGPMRYGGFIFDRSQSKTLLANIDLVLGYDFMRCEGYHLGLFLKTVFPTGNRPNPEKVFSPIIGNAHHWELGGGLDAHYDLWHCDDQCLTASITGSITHLFDDKQWRTFDFNGCCLSRYQLLKVFTKKSNDHLPYANQLMFGTDYTTRQVNSSFDLMGDATLKFVYRNCGWAFGIGYNVYGRSAEDIEPLSDTCAAESVVVANKGTTGVCVINNDNATVTQISNATLSASCIESSDVTIPPTVDNPVLQTGYKTWDNITPAPDSSKPVIYNTSNITYKGAPRQISQKIFGHIDYQWEDCENNPYIGFGGECEFAQNGDCNVCTANQWGMWVHGGLSF